MNTEIKTDIKTDIRTDRTGYLLRRCFHQYLLPMIILNLAFSLSEFTDSIIVSAMLGEQALAVVNVCMPIPLIFNTVAILIGVGGGEEYSRLIGERKEKEAENILNTACLFFAGAGILLMAACVFLFPMLAPVLSKDASMAADIGLYIRYMSTVAFAYIMINGLSPFLTAAGYPNFAAFLVIIANVINLGMDIVYIQVFGFGVEGTALATGTGYLAAFVILIVFMAVKGMIKIQKPAFADFSVLGELFSLGASAGLGQFGLAVKLSVISSLAGSVAGLTGQVTFSLCLQTLSIVSLLLGGMVNSAVPIVSTLYGEKDINGIRRLLKYAMAFFVAALLVVFLFFETGTSLIEKIYSIVPPAGEDPIAHGLRIFSITHLMRCPTLFLMYVYSALRHKKLSIILSVLDCFLVIPLSFLLVSFMGIDGIWWAFVLASALILVWDSLYVFRMNKKSEGKTSGLYMLEQENTEQPILDLTIEQSGAGAAVLSQKVIAFLTENGCSRRQSDFGGLLAEELVTYLLSHAQKMTFIDVMTRIHEDKISIHFRSDGKPISGFLCVEEEEASVNERVLKRAASKCEYARVLGMNSMLVELERK